MTDVRIRALGRLELRVDGGPVRLSPINARLLIRLLVSGGEPVTVEQLYRDVWSAGAGHPMQPEHRNAVQKRIGELRRILDARNPGDASTVIVTDHGVTSAYRLALGRDTVDVWSFTDLAREARHAEPARARDMALRALALWRDRPLPDVPDPFVSNLQRQCEQLRASVRHSLLRAYADLGMYREARELGLDLLVDHPDDQEVRALLEDIRGRAAAGQRVLLRHSFDQPRMTFVLAVGDLFAAQTADLVIGFTDTFDTSTEDDRVISRHTMQGQLLQRLYAGSRDRLDRDLSRALDGVAPVGEEAPADKPDGKRVRYPVGTVAVLPDGQRSLFCVAYSRMGNDLVARSSVERLGHSLARLWDAVHRRGQFADLAMPLVGSGLSRISEADHQDLLELIVRSFVAAARATPVCRELRVVLTPPQVDKIVISQLEELLRTL